MSFPNTTIPVGSLVLVTGITGFVASHITKQFLERGYKVRGTVRDLAQASWLIDDHFSAHAQSGDLELVAVPDLAAENAFDEAVKGVSAIAHLACILSFDPNPHNVIPQNVAGVRAILTAAAKEPSVRELVFTSSIASATLPGAGNDTWVGRDTWNDAAVEAAWAPPPYEPSRAIMTYAAGKVAAERELWNFVREKKPHFVVNTICPSGITGAPLHEKHAHNYTSWVAAIFRGNKDLLDTNFAAFYVDVQDVAALHVAAILDPEVKNARLHCWGHSANWNDFFAILREIRPQRELLADYPENHHLPVTTDQSESVAILKKWTGQQGWKALKQSLEENIQNPYFKL